MTDNTQPEAMDLADWLEAVGGGPSAKRCAALLREQHARIAELESELEAVGAGGVSGPLMGIAAPPTAQAEGWTKASKQLPPCREDQLYIGINTAGFAGVFNAVRVVNGNTYCLMEVAEESVSIMSDLAIWKPFNPPTSAEGVEHG